MSRPLRLWLPVVAWAGLIFVLSSVPDLGTGLGGWDLVLRKIGHAAEFAVLGALLVRALFPLRRRQSRHLRSLEPPSSLRLRPAWLAIALGVLYAVSDEVHQTFVPGREGSPLDVAIDTVGVAFGVVVWQRVARARSIA